MDPLNAAVAVAGVAITALVAERPPPNSVRAGIVGGLFVAVHWVRLMSVDDVGNWDLALVAVHAAATFGVAQAGGILASLRATHESLIRASRDGLGPCDVLSSDLVVMVADARSHGFETLADGTGIAGDQCLVALAHPDGTYLTLVQTEQHPPGFGFSTPLSDGTWVESVPWLPGIDRSVIRIPGASLSELLEHHRAAVAERVGSGCQPRPVDVDGGTALLLDRELEGAVDMLSPPWRNAVLLMLQQSPFQFLVLR